MDSSQLSSPKRIPGNIVIPFVPRRRAISSMSEKRATASSCCLGSGLLGAIVSKSVQGCQKKSASSSPDRSIRSFKIPDHIGMSERTISGLTCDRLPKSARSTPSISRSRIRVSTRSWGSNGQAKSAQASFMTLSSMSTAPGAAGARCRPTSA